MSDTPFPRLFSFLRERSGLVGALALVAILAGGSFAYEAYVAQERSEERIERARWDESAAFTYSVPVTRNDTLWPEGTVLPMGEPAYFRTVSPFVHLNFTWRAASPPTIEGVVFATLHALVRAEADDGRAYWEISHPLAEGIFDAPATGLTLGGTLDLDRLHAEASQAAQQLPPQGRLNWSVVAVVKYALEPEPGSREAATRTYRLPIAVSDPRWTLPGPEALRWDESHAKVETVVLTRAAGWPGVLASIWALLLILGGSGGLALVGIARRTDPARGLAEDEAEFRREHDRFHDLVTTTVGGIDERNFPQPLIDVESLDALVELAAEARTRAILDPARRVYYAVLPSLTYRYAKHAKALARHHARAAPEPQRTWYVVPKER